MKKKMYVEPSLQVVKMDVVVLQVTSPSISSGGEQNPEEEVEGE
jgi:hypothetical protein